MNLPLTDKQAQELLAMLHTVLAHPENWDMVNTDTLAIVAAKMELLVGQ